MKIIDLLYMIANGLELPRILKYDDIIWKMNNNFEDYAEWYSDDVELFDYILNHFNIQDILEWKLDILESKGE